MRDYGEVLYAAMERQQQVRRYQFRDLTGRDQLRQDRRERPLAVTSYLKYTESPLWVK
jgi:hypothetical protein